jgi:bifunctional NMN adenylyltransferase/nudix hydrolase
MKVCVYIGRFQPFHSGHLSVLKAALAQHDRVIMVLGSSNWDRDLDRNPWDFHERVMMILGSLGEKALCERVKFIRMHDYPGENDAWVKGVVHYVEQYTTRWAKLYDEKVETFLTGCKKDESSFYLDLLPWQFVPAPPHGIINATDIRKAIGGYSKFELVWQTDPACCVGSSSLQGHTPCDPSMGAPYRITTADGDR